MMLVGAFPLRIVSESVNVISGQCMLSQSLLSLMWGDAVY